MWYIANASLLYEHGQAYGDLKQIQTQLFQNFISYKQDIFSIFSMLIMRQGLFHYNKFGLHFIWFLRLFTFLLLNLLHIEHISLPELKFALSAFTQQKNVSNYVTPKNVDPVTTLTVCSYPVLLTRYSNVCLGFNFSF